MTSSGLVADTDAPGGGSAAGDLADNESSGFPWLYVVAAVVVVVVVVAGIAVAVGGSKSEFAEVEFG
jgi:high-affinity Fe2+/Pb2+ permease